MTGLDQLARALAETTIETRERFAGAPASRGRGEREGGDAGGNSPDVATAYKGAGGRFRASRPTDSPQQRLLDVLVPRETAEEALRVYDYHLLRHGPVYALQQAFVYIAESEGWRRGGER